ncbi:MAG: hypothetical protein K6G12_11725 [Lachnospiraceae bacterium]|nr:hypothetical protein [Lachnospiraceae bacterium]
MRLDDDEEYSGLSVRMPTIIIAASAAIFAILAIVLAVNSSGKKKHTYTAPATETAAEAETVEETTDSMTAADLNFWDMYQEEDETTILEQQTSEYAKRKDELEQREADMKKAEEEAAEAAAKEAEENADPATDGKHTLVTHIDGSTEWIAINSSIKLNSYEDTQFQSQNGIMGYYVNGRKATKTGVDISQYTTAIDWERLTTEADFVMIRVGARGYDTGNIIADTKFVENVTNAVKYKIPFGVYFSSQAINETEAKEEAVYVMTQLAVASSAVGNLQTSNQTTTSATGSTPVQNNTATSSQTTTSSSVPTTVQDILKKLGIETDPTKYGTTTSVKDDSGNTTTTVTDNLGNTTVTVTDANGTQISKKTVNMDPYGNVTTVVTDASGNETVNTEKVDGAGTNAAGTANTTVISNVAANNTFKMTYPVAVEMHMITNDISRIEGINKTMRTTVLTTFCDAIETGGYNSMVAGSKEFLLCQVNTAGLSKYQIWLSNEGNLPDYPYVMSMWKYNTKGKLMQSLSGDYGVSVGFIDYSAR